MAEGLQGWLRGGSSEESRTNWRELQKGIGSRGAV